MTARLGTDKRAAHLALGSIVIPFQKPRSENFARVYLPLQCKGYGLYLFPPPSCVSNVASVRICRGAIVTRGGDPIIVN